GLPRPAHRLERRRDGPVRGQPFGERLLVISIYDGLGLGQEAPDADGGHHLAVREVVRDLPRGPVAIGGTVELIVGDPLQRLGHLAVSVPVLPDQPPPLFGVHRKIVGCLRRWGCSLRPIGPGSKGCSRLPAPPGQCRRPTAASISHPIGAAMPRSIARRLRASSRSWSSRARRAWCPTLIRRSACSSARTGAETRSGSSALSPTASTGP